MDTPTTEETKQPNKYALLAAEQYGSNYHGEVPEQEDVEEPEEVETEVEEVEEVEAEADEPEQQAEEADNEEEIDEPEEVPIGSIQELIETNEYDPEWFNSLKVPVKVNGEQSEVTLADLQKSYQITEAAEKRLEEAKTKAKTLTTEMAEKSEAVAQQLTVTATLIEEAQNNLIADENAIDWAALRRDDPAEFSAKKDEFRERRAKIEATKNKARQEYTKLVEQQSQEQEKAHQERLKQESELLVQKLPEWSDPEKAKAEKTALAEYLANQGFSSEEISGLTDHRFVLQARKAMLFDSKQQGTKAAAKKVAKIPKVMKPGAPKSPEQTNSQKLAKLKAKAERTGSLDDAFAYRQALKRAK
jgi:hypothetical protein